MQPPAMTNTSTATRRKRGPSPQQRAHFRRYVLTGKHLRADGGIKSVHAMAREFGATDTSILRWLHDYFPEIAPQPKPFHVVQAERAAKREAFRQMVRNGDDRDEYGRRLSYERLARIVGVSYWTVREWTTLDFPGMAATRTPTRGV
jgi:transposase-like protein